MITIFFVCLAVVLLIYALQRKLIYFPSNYCPTPSQARVGQMQVVSLHTADGLTLHAWYCPASNKPTIVYFHGNAGHIGDRAILVAPYLTHGYGVLLVTYRGYSQNPGKPTETGLYKDARAALDFLEKQGVTYTVLFGESIGTAVAIQMATERPISALILQSPFSSLTAVGQYHYPYLPVRWILKDIFASVDKAKNIHVPVLVIHGQNDSIIPPALGYRLVDAFPGSKKVVYVPNRGHNDLYEPALVIQFLNSLVQ